jgi:oxaloacetate decarboxylase alpha subunit
MAKHAPKLCDTSLRDAHQSLFATRMKTEDMIPILEQIDAAGYYSLEMWGGATFDTCMRFLNEDPWERLWTIRKHIKNTKLQMLLRGQNILGYRNYPDDVVEEFVKAMVKGGIDIVRIFDALNDVRNMQTAIRATKEAGAHAQGTVVYTISPVHDIPLYVKIAKELVELGVDSICIKTWLGYCRLMWPI